ncbi:SEP-domain-containing protein [Basidiobolus meristosporus CBS 931.73]|uniref:SEP-domain-containing protein n=1 Tax=Basidiobolus meristosporus CBS 931.73 TaxID=1314790 RepID=A0A1Y1YJX0_9FUNG|nr:SEP-domain-containing protein [Basidiobolus meristosporus CBS 931.73]|eukprot:ORX98046.1 SEP-domain-containing protein [Basidiobolus meristosporus CBS 931.73]
MADQDQLIAQFNSITGSDVQNAKFFLEANNWDVNAAVSNFFESGEPNVASNSPSEPPQPQPQTQPSVTTSRPTRASGIATFHDLEKEDSDEEKQSYFTGGEKSGMLVQDPNLKKEKSNALVDDILKKAAEGGESYPPWEEEEEAPSQPHFFTGAGRSLGGPSGDASTTQPSSSRPANSATDNTPVVRNLTFWRNGFNIDDEPLRSYDEPENQEFLQAINRGQAPLSHLNVRPGQPVDLRVAKRLDEDYIPPPKVLKPFSGSGQRLGGVAPAITSYKTPGAFPESDQPPAQVEEEVKVDESQPVTSIQIRLADGSRLVGKFNHSHTVGDIRRFINSSRPSDIGRDYTLQTSFPVQRLTDDSATLEQASLLNSVVMQRYA